MYTAPVTISWMSLIFPFTWCAVQHNGCANFYLMPLESRKKGDEARNFASFLGIMRLPVGKVGLLDLVTSLVDKATKAVWDFEFEKFNRAYSERRLLNLKQ